MAKLIISFILCINLQASEIEYKSASESFKMIVLKNFTVSIDCQKNSNCIALKKTTEKTDETLSDSKKIIHPASHFCTDAGGTNKIFKNSENQEFDFCEFADKSMIDSWNLYYAHHPKNLIKN